MKKNILNDLNNTFQDFRNITKHFTDKNKIIPLASLIILLSSFNILFINNISSTSALSYQSTSKVEFNINPTVSITINGGDLSIPSLAPGDSKDSNIITVTASSNAMNGYSLSSTVGDSTNASTELRKDSIDTTYKFSSISTNKPSLSDFDSSTNTWGYSYCNTSSDCTTNTNWISGDITITDPTSPLYPTTGYNGLPIYTTESPITLINSSTATTNSIQFKIGARSTTTLVAGEYTNIINFIGIANNNPEIIYMQDATMADCGKTMVDIRDNNVYSTTNVEDTCWMTTNLNLAGDTVLSSTDTDFTSDYYPNLPNDNGWTVVDNNKLKMPSSSTEGFSVDNYAYVYNSGNVSNDCSAPGCYSYYSWDAATLGSGRSITTDNTDAPHSICPAGWHLPNTRTGTDDTSDFRKLMIALGGSAEIASYGASTNPTGAQIFNQLSSTPFNFLRSGFCYNNSFDGGNTFGYYWSITSISNTRARGLYFNSSNVSSASYDFRKYGFALRCVKSS